MSNRSFLNFFKFLKKVICLLILATLLTTINACDIDYSEIENRLPGIIDEIGKKLPGVIDDIEKPDEPIPPEHIVSVLKAPWEGEATITQGNFASRDPKNEDGNSINSHFPEVSYKYGIDISRKVYDDTNFIVLAVADGTVVELENTKMDTYKTGWGNYILIRHNQTLYSLYAHLKEQSVFVKKGQKVKTGTVLGYAGNTGNSRGTHLHFQVMNQFDKVSCPITNFEIDNSGRVEIVNNTKDGEDFVKDGGYFKNSVIENSVLKSTNEGLPIEFDVNFSLVDNISGLKQYIQINYDCIVSAKYYENNNDFDVQDFIVTFTGSRPNDSYFFQVAQESLVDEDPDYLSKYLDVVADNLYLSKDKPKKGYLKIVYSSFRNQEEITVIIHDSTIVTCQNKRNSTFPVQVIPVD